MSRSRLIVLLPVLVAASCTASQPGTSTPSADAGFDVLITGGRIVDGTGAPWFEGDIGIVGDRITALGHLDGQPAAMRIDADGAYVAPGFIDMLGQSEFNVLVDGRAASKITQGVTTEITGEGSSIAPLDDRLAAEAKAQFDAFKVSLDFRTLGEYFARLADRSHPAINIGTFVGAGGVRGYVIGDSQREATPDELERMKTLVRQAMEQGALGLSTSLQYVPDR
ncbi:MAG: amidohydrolase family protein, partial [Vicinamibacterales bacterium]